MDHSGREARAEGVDQLGRVVYAGHHVHAHATAERRQHLERLARLLLARHSPPVGKEAAGTRWAGRPAALRGTRGQRAGSAPEQHPAARESGARRRRDGSQPREQIPSTTIDQSFMLPPVSTLTIATPPHNLVLADRLMLLSLSKGSGGGAARPWAPRCPPTRTYLGFLAVVLRVFAGGLCRSSAARDLPRSFRRAASSASSRSSSSPSRSSRPARWGKIPRQQQQTTRTRPHTHAMKRATMRTLSVKAGTDSEGAPAAEGRTARACAACGDW